MIIQGKSKSPRRKISKALNDDPKQNRILAALPLADFQRIRPELAFVPMPLGWRISDAGDHVEFIHFPTTGVVSLIHSLEDGSSSETALVGNEGMIGISIFMGGESLPSNTVVQSVGAAYRLSRKIMKREFEIGGALHQLALLFTQALFAQTSQTAVCNQHHSIENQMCRWLLMTADRLNQSSLVVTHELLGHLLGVRRESITQSAVKLKKEGLIDYARGGITILNHAKLLERACECYVTVKMEYERLLPQQKAAADTQ